MEIYETEEEQVAAIKRWWKENGTSTIAGVIAGLAMLGGWNFWTHYQQDKAEQASAMYSQLLESISQEKPDSTLKMSERLAQQFSASAYADYATLLKVKTQVEQGDLDSAKTALEKLMQDAHTIELQHIARLRLITLTQAAGENEKGLQLIAEADQSSIQGFAASYDELKGDLYVALDRLGEARTAYQSALRAGATSPLLQFKLDDISAAELVTTN